MLDIGISAVLAVVTIFLAYLGIQVTLHPPASGREVRAYKVKFVACAGVAVALVLWQGVRNPATQQTTARQMKGLQDEVASAKKALEGEQTQVNSLRESVGQENARRQQAEKDMQLLVQVSGQQTRTGVAEDIRKSPLSVQLNGQPVAINQGKMDRLSGLASEGRIIRESVPRPDASDDSIPPWLSRVDMWWSKTLAFLEESCRPQALVIANDTSNMLGMSYAGIHPDKRIQSTFHTMERFTTNLTDLVKRPELCP